jgi:hypothetical protein
MPSTPAALPAHRPQLRRLAVTGTLLAALALSACTKDPKTAVAEAVADGTMLKQVKALVDGRPQCARLLYGWEPFALTGPEDLDLPSVRALIDAGLIEAIPDQAAGQSQRWRSAAAAQAQMRQRPLNQEQQTLDLCYGKRQVTRVWLDEKWSDYGSIPYVQYAFRIVDPAPWVTPGMRQTFPFLERALSTELISQDMVPVKDGKAEMSMPLENLQLPDEMIEAFDFCPAGVAKPNERCQRAEAQRQAWKREQEKEAEKARQTLPPMQLMR